MIIASNREGSVEVVVYETDQLFIALLRGGRCVARITIPPDAPSGAITDFNLHHANERLVQ